jgi:hypothetical protein
MDIDVAEIVRTVALASSALVSLLSAFIAYSAVRSQRNVAKHTANLTRLNRAADLIPNSPKLLEFHGISLEDLHDDGISETEMVYLLYLFEAGDIYYTIEGSHEVDLRPYRKITLQHPRVRLVWRKYLDKKIFHLTPFSKAVNKYIDDNYPDEIQMDTREEA